ncbi:MAG: hypothetical protein EBT36_10265 [Betaproteobacteria bacterium]|nr:hypothetical protein [Betaproteobacteria bacterium]
MASSPAGQEQRIEARIWQELQRATRDRHHEWRTPVLASLGPEQQVDARTVVLRRKVAAFRKHPRGLLHCWSKRLRWQLRIAVEVSVHDAGPYVEELWDQIKATAAAKDYLSPRAPGTLLSAGPGSSTEVAQPHCFCLLKASFIEMDWLALGREGHERARLSVDGWQWLVP